MPNIITSELTSWQGETVVGASGDIYRIDDATNDGFGVRVWVWNAKHRDLDELDPAGQTMTRDEALAAIEAHTLAALAAKEPTPPTDDEQRQDELRNEAAQRDYAYGHVLTAVNAITDTTDRRTVLAALDKLRQQQFDDVRVEHWVFPGAPIGKFSTPLTHRIALEDAEECAAEWAQKHEGQATVVNVQLTRNPDGSWWAPAQYAQYQGVVFVSEDQLRQNEE